MSMSVVRMEEDIVVDDVDDNDIETYSAENSSSHILPTTTTLFIPHGKLRTGQTTVGNQTMVSPSASQLATFIHPVNNQVSPISKKSIFLHTLLLL